MITKRVQLIIKLKLEKSVRLKLGAAWEKVIYRLTPGYDQFNISGCENHKMNYNFVKIFYVFLLRRPISKCYELTHELEVPKK